MQFRTHTPNYSKVKLLYTACFVMIMLLTVSNIVLAGRSVTQTSELKIQEQQLTELQDEKEHLMLKLSQQTALRDIEQQAVEAGYQPIAQTFAIQSPTDNVVALR